MIVNMIAARSANGIIGIGNGIPWRIPGEQKQFKNLTMHNAVIMGRKTYESIGRPLKNRINIVVSTTAHYGGRWDAGELTNLVTVRSLEEALEMVDGMTNVEAFIAGGGTLYEQALPLTDRLYMTDINTVVHPDETAVYFPQFSTDEFIWTDKEECHEAHTGYTRKTWIRKTSLLKFGPELGWEEKRPDRDVERRVSTPFVIGGHSIGNISLSKKDNISYSDYVFLYWSINGGNSLDRNIPGMKGMKNYSLDGRSFEDFMDIAGVLVINMMKDKKAEHELRVNALDKIMTNFG